MRLLLVTDVFPPRCGGSGWSTYHLARALRLRGHHVTIARPQTALPMLTRRVSHFDGFAIHELGLPRVAWPLVRGLARQEFYWPRFGRFVREVARRGQVDLLHGQHLLSIPAAVRAGDDLGRPVVATVRDYWPTCPIGTRMPCRATASVCSTACRIDCLARGNRVLRPAVWALSGYVAANLRRRQGALRAADRVVAVSAHVARVLRDGIPGLEPVVVPNFIDLDEFDRQAGDNLARAAAVVLYVGKLEHHKGADLLPSALASARGATLVVAGDGPLRAWIETECARRGINVELRGEVANEEVARLMRVATLLLFPARWEEPLSRTLLEAGAAGLPVIALATGGTPEIVRDGVTGLLVDRPAHLAGAVAELLGDRQRLRSYGIAARTQIAEHFSRDVVVPRMERLYRGALATPGRLSAMSR